MSNNELMLDRVAGELFWLRPEPVFVGGATIGLFLDDFGRSQLRPTKDVDCIVPSVLTRAGWWALEEQLRNHGWEPDSEGPVCRYISPEGLLRVDLMAENPDTLGFAGRWYPDVVQHAVQHTLVTGRSVKVPTPELLLACKLEAWNDRGKDDPLASKDLEDIVAMLDGCAELETRICAATEPLRGWITQEFSVLINCYEYSDAALGHLPRGGDEKFRQEQLDSLMQRLSGVDR